MNSFWRKTSIIILLILFILVMGLGALYYNFPYQAAAGLLQRNLASTFPVVVKTTQIKPGRPFTLKMDQLDVGVRHQTGTSWMLQTENVRVRLKPLAALLGNVAGGITAKSGEGWLKGRFSGSPFKNRLAVFSLNAMDLPGFMVEWLPSAAKLSGHLTGSSEISGRRNGFPTGGQGTLTIASGHFTGQPVPGLPKFDHDFEQIQLDFVIEKNGLTVKKLYIKAPKLETTLTGRINNLARPSLDLHGTAPFKLPNGVTRPLSFRVTGPAGKPRLKLGSEQQAQTNNSSN